MKLDLVIRKLLLIKYDSDILVIVLFIFLKKSNLLDTKVLVGKILCCLDVGFASKHTRGQKTEGNDEARFEKSC